MYSYTLRYYNPQLRVMENSQLKMHNTVEISFDQTNFLNWFFTSNIIAKFPPLGNSSEVL